MDGEFYPYPRLSFFFLSFTRLFCTADRTLVCPHFALILNQAVFEPRELLAITVSRRLIYDGHLKVLKHQQGPPSKGTACGWPPAVISLG
jgi:hypothetical protein